MTLNKEKKPQRICGLIRITADIDTHDLSETFLSLVVASEKLEIEQLVIRKSTNKGYHLIVFTKQLLKTSDIFKYRKLLGDDKKRVTMDKRRKRPKQYLFKKKISLK